ncbi:MULTISPECIES: NAD(P)H-dependent oxidoreductase [Pseudomonas]|uniref:NAD(P)H-dependent oxidoreductase n=1 Tax=Pseudomonas TaxID=286 RepID=UPI0007B37BDF|nr:MULTISPECIES: NAD(P)H-dependent oxidoreductase [Pseudomonas]AZC56608.1 Putative NADPH-quinone reductase [Pseudomonas chlororaphis subsp. piscium]AZC62826.1 Putative NADPH-quinone reductase [Pseudomonas chlororaphis subsp. piscium]AZC69062.1 Putative NADPH-quinone reductase [Pseudomonas chlororaphis subsp. piscium]AZC75244.1 Putative NADPH-quinone reductase [Pseudomonas chlororaphis subsp. piscium]AZC81515.1 Putative NADPH-quinone reductase [Pseudomonas chlororaphis subsp. piscium]
MHALIVVAHHDARSLSHSLAAQVAEGLGPSHSFEIADLFAEAFDPRFNAADHAVHRRQEQPPADVLAEQARIDRADALVLVYPVYWWSMPALLKGWIDRVFANGWAFDFSLEENRTEKKLGHLRVHLLGVGGADAGTYGRHGYEAAMKAQIDHGIFDYCGARVLTSELLLESESQDPALHLRTARSIGRDLFSRAGATAAVQAG